MENRLLLNLKRRECFVLIGWLAIFKASAHMASMREILAVVHMKTGTGFKNVESAAQWILSLGILLCTNMAVAEGNVAYWLAPRANTLIDEQVAHEIGMRAGLVVLRAERSYPDKAYTFPELVDRLKKNAPRTPVLAYAVVSRIAENGRIESDLLKGATLGSPIVEVENADEGRVRFLNVANRSVRSSVIKQLSVERQNLGVDGFALDLSMRTPAARPKPLAKVCRMETGYCERYSQGMDDLFASLHTAIGNDGYLVYNGLWNFKPGMLEDQARLLARADAVAIEYFGMNPGLPSHGFSTDVLPYINIISRLPKDKAVLVFARGPWSYTDYVTDYRWQRYLFSSFLLAKRNGDLFKYHASFQVPAHKGRAGGLDVYEDWNIVLGEALGPYSVEGGLYMRKFSGGLVVVAPDDGDGDVIRLTGSKYSLEGKSLTGEVRLLPGDSLIALNNPDKGRVRPVSHVYTARGMASWCWSNAELKTTPKGDVLKLDDLPEKMEGEHDLLLDYERSLTPYQKLEIKARLLDSISSLLAVAEVDDLNDEHVWVVVDVSTDKESLGMREREAVDFRTPSKKRDQAAWPLIHVQYPPDINDKIILDGPKILDNTGYRFRRWSHLRFTGAVEVSGVEINSPTRLQ